MSPKCSRWEQFRTLLFWDSSEQFGRGSRDRASAASSQRAKKLLLGQRAQKEMGTGLLEPGMERSDADTSSAQPDVAFDPISALVAIIRPTQKKTKEMVLNDATNTGVMAGALRFLF